MVRRFVWEKVAGWPARTFSHTNPLNRVRHHFANFSIRTFKPYHAICTAAVRTWAKFQIASVNESEDRDV